MSQDNALCQCITTIRTEGKACAMCRIEQLLDYNYVENLLGSIDADPFLEGDDYE